jgi:hypothetical protein
MDPKRGLEGVTRNHPVIYFYINSETGERNVIDRNDAKEFGIEVFRNEKRM